MTFYADSKYPVNDELSGAHALQFEKFAQAGTWGTADQRLAVIAEARQAGIEAGLLEAPKMAARNPRSLCLRSFARSSGPLPWTARRSIWRPISGPGRRD